MESLEGLCFTHLCSYLFFNELLILRLVSTSIKRELEGREFALNVGQAGALIFPSHWGDSLPREPSSLFHSSGLTKGSHGGTRSGTYARDISQGILRNSSDESRRSLPENGDEISSTPCTRVILNVPGKHKSRPGEKSNEGEEWNSRMFFCRFLSLQSIREGLRELCLCWQETDQPRRLSSALRELLKVCAPFLESLVCSGSCLAVWRYSFPLELNFPVLYRLLIISSFRDSELSVRHYREQLTWHVLGRCQFPACVEFRWMDFFSENFLETFSNQVADDVGEAVFQIDKEADEAEEKGFFWHEITLQQVDRLTTLLSSMRCLRDFTFTADSRYSIVQILSYVAAQQGKGTISTIEIVPAYPNIETLDRDWLLPPIADTDPPGGTPDAIPSVKTLRLVLRNCKLEDIVGADIFRVLRRVCPNANICVAGSIRTSVETADATVRCVLPQATDTVPVVPCSTLPGDTVAAEHVPAIPPQAFYGSAPTQERDGIVDVSCRGGPLEEDDVEQYGLANDSAAHRVKISSSMLFIETFCTAPLEIIFSIPERETSVFRRPAASVKFVRMTGVGREDESACLYMSQAVKKLLHLKNSVLPSIRFGPVALCTRTNADKIERLISHFSQIILSIEGYGADPECFIHEIPKLSKASLSSPDFFHPSPCTTPSAFHQSFSSTSPVFATRLNSSSKKNIEVVGLQINLSDGTLSSDLPPLLKILNKHPAVLFLRFVDTWSAAAFKKTTSCVEQRLFGGIVLNVLLRYNRCQIKVFEYTCVGPVCWQREAGLFACGPGVPEIVGKDFFLHKKVAFLAAGGAYGSEESDAVQQLFSSLYVRGSNPRL